MTYKDLYDLVPQVVAENMTAINDAIAYVENIHAVADDDIHRQEAEKLIERISTQRYQLYRIGGNIQKSIYQMAMMAKMVDGFPPVEEMKVGGDGL